MLFILKENDYLQIFDGNENVTKDDLLKCCVSCYFKDEITIYDFYYFMCNFLNTELCCYSISHLRYYPSDFMKNDIDGFKKYVCYNKCLLAVLENFDEKLYIVYLV